ncbi:hypothetical protein MRX96_010334 [Rhipicephalus microplus]
MWRTHFVRWCSRLEKMYEFINSHTFATLDTAPFAPQQLRAPVVYVAFESVAGLYRRPARAFVAIVRLHTSGICSKALFISSWPGDCCLGNPILRGGHAGCSERRWSRSSTARLEQIGFIFQRLPRSRNRSPSGLKAKAGAPERSYKQEEESSSRETFASNLSPGN